MSTSIRARGGSKYRSRKRRPIKYSSKVFNRGPSTKNLAKRLTKLQRNFELKYEDVYQSTLVPTTSGTASLTLLNGVGAGTDPDDRIGYKVRATSLKMAFTLQTNEAVVSQTRIRCIVFWDRQPNGAVPPIVASGLTSRSLLDSTTVGNSILMPYNRTSQKRFKILYDQIFTLNPSYFLKTTSVTTGGPLPGVSEATTTDASTVQLVLKTVRRKIPLGRTVDYNSTGSVITGVTTNALWVVFFAIVPCQVEFSSRFNFKDQ